MRIMVTGGTGFIGYHTVERLLEAGHEIVLLVRDEKKMRGLFADRIKHFVVGDLKDEAAINQALDGCDAVIHIAALVSIDAADEEYIYQTNFNGTKRVIGGAVKLGIKKIIYVSSITAIYDPKSRLLDENSPPGRARKGYGGSKVASEIYVQGLQDSGAPIHITYPGTVIGPDAPAVTEAHNGLKLFLNSYMPVFETGNQYIDVRDVAEAHLQLIERQLPPGRFPLGGHCLEWREHPVMLSKLTGRKIKPLAIPTKPIMAASKVSDWLSNYGIYSILTSESINYATNFVPMSNDKAMRDLDLLFIPLEDSMCDSIKWMADNGHIGLKKAGAIIESVTD